MKSPNPEAQNPQMVFLTFDPLIVVFTVSNDISITQVRANDRKTELDLTFETSLTINLMDKSFNNSIEW